ncbi:hypothetical protein FRC0129_00663 [Corynebacterium diphtheriae]|nr:hypothetical protein CIP107509_00673 [Corynebacterium diphtheriae]CAB0741704.1 hypothetical protein FRC0129_00663 [Corynebacterium diphtheriae]CAB0891804.1 hypothetical protein FRC0430_00369 [Corynebacterium diphtheriae]CAB0940710.1 hypothetical protein FRC0436_00454 [Corynebacterium diphtheriae]
MGDGRKECAELWSFSLTCNAAGAGVVRARFGGFASAIGHRDHGYFYSHLEIRQLLSINVAAEVS